MKPNLFAHERPRIGVVANDCFVQFQPYCMSFTNPLCGRFLWVVPSGGSEGFMEPADCCQPSGVMRPAPCWNVLDPAQTAKQLLEADSTTNASWKLAKGTVVNWHGLLTLHTWLQHKRPASSIPVLAVSFNPRRPWPVLQVWDEFDWMSACSQRRCGMPAPFGKLTYEDLNWSIWTCFSVEHIQTLKREDATTISAKKLWWSKSTYFNFTQCGLQRCIADLIMGMPHS